MDKNSDSAAEVHAVFVEGDVSELPECKKRRKKLQTLRTLLRYMC